MKNNRKKKRPPEQNLMTHVVELHEVEVEARTASFLVRATNQLGTRTILGAYFVPETSVLERLAGVPLGTRIRVTSRNSDKPRPCAMTLIDFEVVAP